MQSDFICLECPLAECDEGNLFGALRWVTKPNEVQRRLLTQAKQNRTRQIKRNRLKYFRERYQARKQLNEQGRELNI
jgi:hypothetical protein